MSTKFLSLTGLEQYDDLIKAYVDTGLAGKSGSTHTHDDRYYTESEVDSKLAGKSNTGHKHTVSEITDLTATATELNYMDGVTSNVQTQIDNITNGTKTVSKATSATYATTATNAGTATYATKAGSADSATNASTANYANSAGSASKLGTSSVGSGTQPIYLNAGVATTCSTYAGGTRLTLNNTSKAGSSAAIYAPTTGGTAGQVLKSAGTASAPVWETLDVYNKAEVDTKLSGKSDTSHNHDSKYDAKGASTVALSQSKSYTDEKIALLLNNSSEAVDSIMELATAMEDNADAIEALQAIAGNKADKTHGHEISDVNGLQSALDGKAASSHGTHVTWSTTSPKMAASTASVGSETKVARGDHVHPTDTSRASKTEFDTHVASTVSHITSSERNTWNAKASTASATTASAGLMSAADKTKLNGIAEGANKYVHPTTSGNKHIPSGGASGQFLKWSENGTAVWAADNDTKYAAGTGIGLSGTTFSNAGVRSVVTGTTNGTIIVNTNGTTAAVPVKGLGNAAYTSIDTALSSTSTNAVQNKVVNSAITTLTSAVTANTNSISALTSTVGAIEAITSEEISALFA